MDDGSPTLEVGFAIETGGSFDSLTQLQSVMDSVEARIVADANSIERATGGMLKLGTATAELRAFGNAHTREAQNIVRESARVEKAGERIVRQLERENASYGKTRGELRAMKAEEAALAAERVGNADLALRIRQQEADLWGKEAAAARMARIEADNAAEAKQAAAMQSAAAMEREEQAIRSAAHAHRMFNAVAAQKMSAHRLEEAAATARLAREHEILAAKVRESHAAQVADAAAAERMRQATDPLYAATSRLNAEIAESTRLYYNGATAPAEYARQQQFLTERLREVERQHSAVNRGLIGVGATGKLTGFHMQNMAFQFQDLGMQMAMAAQSSRPFQMAMMALLQQGTQIKGIMSQAGVGIGAVAAQLWATVAPFAGVITVAGLLGTALLGVKQAAASDEEMRQFAGTLGLTKDEMEKLKNVTVTWGDTFGATMDVVLGSAGLSTEQISGFFGNMWTKVGEFGKFSIAILLGGFAALVKGTGSLIVNTGKLVGNFFIGAANAALEAFEKMVNSAIGGLNKVSGLVNAIFGTDIKAIAEVKLPKIKGKFDLSNPLTDAKDQLYKTFNDVQGGFDKIASRATQRAQDGLRKQAKDIIEDRNPKKERESKAGEALAREMAATEALIKGNYDLAKAYQVSDAAAFEQEVRTRATAEAIKKKADVEVYVAQQMRLAVSQRAVDGGKAIAELTAQTAAQRQVNDAVAAGTLTTEAAQEALRAEAQLRPLLVAQAVAEGDAKAALTGIIARLRGEQAAANAEANRAKVLADTAAGQDKLEQLRLEAKLIGATNVERAKAVALLTAEQFLRANPGASASEAQAYAQTLVDIATLTDSNTTAQNNFNASLSYTSELLGLISGQANELGALLSNAFGNVGDSLGGALSALTDYVATQAKFDEQREAARKSAGTDARALAEIDILYAKKSATAQMAATGQVIAGVKSLFKEKSTAFKVMSAIEKAYAVWQAAETIASIVRDSTKTASHLANSAVRTTANTAEGGSKIFAELGPWAFPVVAAMVAVLAALGARGGGGGVSGPSIPSAGDLQDSAGTGSVLGDTKAKSESIVRSLELVASNTNKDLEFSNDMLKALRSIDTSIAAMAGTVARQIQVSGSMFDTSKLGLGETGKKGFLGLFGGSSTSKSLWDLGMVLNSATVADIIANGIDGHTYQTVQQIKKSNGFLGFGGGTKTSYLTTTGALDGDITTAIQSVIASLRNGLVTAAGVIGLDGAEAMLNGFNVGLGTISFKDMTGEQIEDQLNAIFSSIGDQMAGQLLPSLASMQQMGEGLFETFIRVAKEYEAVDIALRSIGRTFGAIGMQSVAARDALVQLFGGLEEFIEATDFFRDNFLSEAEQIAPVQAAVTAELQRLGLAGLVTRDQFKQAVLGIDLTTAAGREMYASLLALAPAFDKVLDYQEQAQKATIDGLKQTVDQFTKFAESLKKYRDGLFATDAAQGNAYDRLKSQFAATAAMAATGDATALGGLENAGKAFLDASRGQASTREQYLRDVALVARGVDKGIFAAEETADYAQLQLAALGNAVSILTAINANTAATASALGATVTTPTSGSIPVPVPSSLALVEAAATSAASTTGGYSSPSGESDERLIAQNDTIIRQNAQLVDSMTKLERHWSRLDGDGLLVRTDADTPLNVVAE